MSKTQEKKVSQGKIFVFFSQIFLKLQFEWKTQRRIQSGPFFQNQILFYFQKGQGRPPSLVARLPNQYGIKLLHFSELCLVLKNIEISVLHFVSFMIMQWVVRPSQYCGLFKLDVLKSESMFLEWSRNLCFLKIVS